MESKYLRLIKKTDYLELHLQLVPESADTEESFAIKIAQIFRKYNAKIIRATFFGNLEEKTRLIKQLEFQMEKIDFPITWIEGGNCTGSFINGVYIYAVSGIPIDRLFVNSNPVGSIFQTSLADFCYLGGLYSDPKLSPSRQAEKIFNTAETLLKEAGFKYDNTIRTWFYLDKILDWYSDFNRVRTEFYNRTGIFNKLLPASTGIEGKNPAGSNISLELNAIKPNHSGFTIKRIPSPLQCSAEAYGSSFSRAIAYSDMEYSYITISGTASIGYRGDFLHKNDLPKQIELTFRVVDEILKSQGFEFSDTIRAYAYFRNKSFCKELNNYLKINHLNDKLLFIYTENKVCWEDLLFEIELDVVRPKI